MKKTTAILLAGGKGTRFDPSNLKTLHQFNGISLTERVVKDIKDSKLFDDIILVYNFALKDEFAKIISITNIKGVRNGNTRFLSALNGLNESVSEKNIFIDVAAPFYQHKMLKNLIDNLDYNDAVMSTVLDTRADHVLIENDKVAKIFERGKILRVKSYQGVNKSKWFEAFEKTNEAEISKYTEMVKIILDQNGTVGNVVSSNNPRKITTKDDLKFFEQEGWK